MAAYRPNERSGLISKPVISAGGGQQDISAVLLWSKLVQVLSKDFLCLRIAPTSPKHPEVTTTGQQWVVSL